MPTPLDSPSTSSQPRDSPSSPLTTDNPFLNHHIPAALHLSEIEVAPPPASNAQATAGVEVHGSEDGSGSVADDSRIETMTAGRRRRRLRGRISGQVFEDGREDVVVGGGNVVAGDDGYGRVMSRLSVFDDKLKDALIGSGNVRDDGYGRAMISMSVMGVLSNNKQSRFSPSSSSSSDDEDDVDDDDDAANSNSSASSAAKRTDIDSTTPPKHLTAKSSLASSSDDSDAIDPDQKEEQKNEQKEATTNLHPHLRWEASSEKVR
ncbi:unnamed protein product [Zymoseptoria tritici ST99CH_3D1]|nr:unnamed protein product [Zymoseptoria tritici ST99CH_3D1]